MEKGRILLPAVGLIIAVLVAPLATAQESAAEVVENVAETSDSPEELLARFDAYPHAELIDSASETVIDYQIGLGAIQKSRGAWKLKHSERLTGDLQTYTWQIVDGFTSREVAEELSDIVEGTPGSTLLFACESRACGPGVQWANRVFKQRLLYGQESQQRYRVYSLDRESGYRLVIYNSARTADRQYLHVELLKLD